MQYKQLSLQFCFTDEPTSPDSVQRELILLKKQQLLQEVLLQKQQLQEQKVCQIDAILNVCVDSVFDKTLIKCFRILKLPANMTSHIRLQIRPH